MKKIYKSLMALAVAVGFTASASAELKQGEILYGSYLDLPDSEVMNIGTGRAGDYAVAYKIPASFAGRTISAIMVPVQDSKSTTDMKAFLSNKLDSKAQGANNYVFTPDVWSASVKEDVFVERGVQLVQVNLDEPYVIPAGGVYMGYSFTTKFTNTTIEKYPIPAYSDPSIVNPEMAHIFMNTLGWSDNTVTDNFGVISGCVLAVLDGAPQSSAYITGESLIRADLTTESLPFDIANEGWAGVHDVEYTMTIADQTVEGSQHFSSGLPIAKAQQYGVPGVLNVKLPMIGETGDYKYKVVLTKINGKENPSANKEISGSIRIVKKLAKKNPVIEETTCTGCGYCPRGFYGLEVFKRTYFDGVAISYHNQGQGLDPMVCSLYTPSFGGNPNAYVDRVADVNDFIDQHSAGFIPAYESRLNEFTPADLEVKAEWVDDSQEELVITAKASFVEDMSNAKYRIDFAILQDGMTGKTSQWSQANYYSGNANAFTEPEWEVFGKGGSSVRNLKFNDVAIFIGNRYMRGYAGSIPTEIKAGEPIEFSKNIKLDDLRVITDRNGTLGGSLVQNKNLLKVVAILVASGEKGFPIVNGALGYVPGYDFTGIEETPSLDAPSVVAYYDMTGRKVSNPTPGIYVVKYSDGSVVKEVVK